MGGGGHHARRSLVGKNAGRVEFELPLAIFHTPLEGSGDEGAQPHFEGKADDRMAEFMHQRAEESGCKCDKQTLAGAGQAVVHHPVTAGPPGGEKGGSGEQKADFVEQVAGAVAGELGHDGLPRRDGPRVAEPSDERACDSDGQGQKRPGKMSRVPVDNFDRQSDRREAGHDHPVAGGGLARVGCPPSHGVDDADDSNEGKDSGLYRQRVMRTHQEVGAPAGQENAHDGKQAEEGLEAVNPAEGVLDGAHEVTPLSKSHQASFALPAVAIAPWWDEGGRR